MSFEQIDSKLLERIAVALEEMVALQKDNQKFWYRIDNSLDAIENAIIAAGGI
jgi:hypothetical protein